MQKAIVRVLSRGMVIAIREFTGKEFDDNVMKYVHEQTDNGYDCLVLKTLDGKAWYKMWFNPPEAI